MQPHQIRGMARGGITSGMRGSSGRALLRSRHLNVNHLHHQRLIPGNAVPEAALMLGPERLNQRLTVER